MSQAFDMPSFHVQTVEGGGFVGDVNRGGSCNVRLLSFTPHNLTHIETANHVVSGGLTINDIPVSVLSGLCYMVDLSQEELVDGYIRPQQIEGLELAPETTILAIKTQLSMQSPFEDYTGTDPICLHPATTAFLSSQYPQISFLLLDLPSADKEDDGGKLLAHRNFFGLSEHPTGLPKAIMELGYLQSVSSTGYYYVVSTPARVDLDAIITDVVFYDIQ